MFQIIDPETEHLRYFKIVALLKSCHSSIRNFQVQSFFYVFNNNALSDILQVSFPVKIKAIYKTWVWHGHNSTKYWYELQDQQGRSKLYDMFKAIDEASPLCEDPDLPSLHGAITAKRPFSSSGESWGHVLRGTPSRAQRPPWALLQVDSQPAVGSRGWRCHTSRIRLCIIPPSHNWRHRW